MKVSAQLLSSSLSGCGRKLVGFALKVQVSGDLWSPAVVSEAWDKTIPAPHLTKSHLSYHILSRFIGLMSSLIGVLWI